MNFDFRIENEYEFELFNNLDSIKSLINHGDSNSLLKYSLICSGVYKKEDLIDYSKEIRLIYDDFVAESDLNKGFSFSLNKYLKDQFSFTPGKCLLTDIIDHYKGNCVSFSSLAANILSLSNKESKIAVFHNYHLCNFLKEKEEDLIIEHLSDTSVLKLNEIDNTYLEIKDLSYILSSLYCNRGKGFFEKNFIASAIDIYKKSLFLDESNFYANKFLKECELKLNNFL